MSDSTKLIRRKGICKNPDCDMCMSREIQEIEPGEDFICADCGVPLQEVNEKKAGGSNGGGNKSVMMIIIAVAVLAVIGACAWFFMGSGTGGNDGADSTAVVVEKVEEVAVVSGATQAPAATDGTATTGSTAGASSKSVTMQYGKYEGPVSGGQPNGIGGTFTFTTSYTLDLKDGYGNTVDLNAGDKIIDTKFEDGCLQQGEIHFADGKRKYISGLNQKL